jgi:hypothetical protein
MRNYVPKNGPKHEDGRLVAIKELRQMRAAIAASFDHPPSPLDILQVEKLATLELQARQIGWRLNHGKATVADRHDLTVLTTLLSREYVRLGVRFEPMAEPAAGPRRSLAQTLAAEPAA